jgi:tetratricopeptide (TPR) repeat protein
MTKILPLVFLFLSFSIPGFGQTGTMNRPVDSAARVRGMLKTIEFTTKGISNTYNHKAMGNLFLMRGEAETGLKRYTKALDDYTKAIFFDPDLTEVYAYRGSTYDYLKNYQLAIKDYERAIVSFKGDKIRTAIMYNNIAFIEMELKNYQKVIKADSAAIALEPNYAVAYVNRGFAYLAMEKSEKAVADFTAGMGAFRNSPKELSEILKNRADAYRLLGKYKDAITDYNKAIDLNPANPDSFWGRADSYKLNGDYRLADEDYLKAIDGFRADNMAMAKIYVARAEMAIFQRDYKKALYDDSVSISLDNKYPLAYWDRANAYDQLGNFQLGMDAFTQAINLYHDNKDALPAIYNSLASEAYILGQYDKAIEASSSAILVNKKYLGAYLYRGRAYLKKMNKDAAVADFNQVLYGDSTKQSYEYAFALFYTGNGEQAIQLVQSYNTDEMNGYQQTNHYYMMACLYALVNKPDDANACLKRSLNGGYSKKYAQSDPDFDNIRNTPEFKDMVALK